MVLLGAEQARWNADGAGYVIDRAGNLGQHLRRQA